MGVCQGLEPTSPLNRKTERLEQFLVDTDVSVGTVGGEGQGSTVSNL